MRIKLTQIIIVSLHLIIKFRIFEQQTSKYPMRLKSPKKEQFKYHSLTLNSYKIDTTSLQERARELQQLKSQLTTQISQYKVTQSTINQQLAQLKSQKKQLKSTIKQLRDQLSNINKTSYKAKEEKLQNVSKQVERYKNEIKILKAEVQEMRQYKKMYQIEVQNKNNITKFYENKLDSFKKDKTKLVQKYQEKISMISSGFGVNNALNSLQNKFINTANFQKPNISKQPIKQSHVESQSQSSNKQIKIIKTANKANNNNINHTTSINNNPTSPKRMSSTFIYQTPKVQCKTTQNINVNQLPIDSSTQIHYRTTTSPQIKLNNSTSEDIFLDLVQSIFVNLNQLQLKSDEVRLLPNIKSFCQMMCPTRSDMQTLFTSDPLKCDLPRQKIEKCIQKIQKYLKLKYNSCSGRLIVQLILDKIQDYEIAYQVNENEIQVAGLSVTDTDQNDSQYLSFGRGYDQSSRNSQNMMSTPVIRKRVSIMSSKFGDSKIKQ